MPQSWQPAIKEKAMSTQCSAAAGTLESNDIFITITATGEKGVSINLSSIVMHQFGDDIKAAIQQSMDASGLDGVEVTAQDKGALECTIKARMETAIARFKEKM